MTESSVRPLHPDSDEFERKHCDCGAVSFDGMHRSNCEYYQMQRAEILRGLSERQRELAAPVPTATPLPGPAGPPRMLADHWDDRPVYFRHDHVWRGISRGWTSPACEWVAVDWFEPEIFSGVHGPGDLEFASNQTKGLSR